jgi:hypothetical protein
VVSPCAGSSSGPSAVAAADPLLRFGRFLRLIHHAVLRALSFLSGFVFALCPFAYVDFPHLYFGSDAEYALRSFTSLFSILFSSLSSLWLFSLIAFAEIWQPPPFSAAAH